MNENIFREYDIRGVVETDFTKDVVISIAKSLGTLILSKGYKNCVIGYDARHSADFLFTTFSETLNSLGIDVISIGECTTPMLYFAQIDMTMDAGVMITGSHNPSDMNGFKMLLKDGAIFGEAIQNLKNLILDSKLAPEVSEKGTTKTVLIKDKYTSYLKENITLGKEKLKIVVDGGNGTGGEIASEVFRDLGCEVIELYTKPDGDFPNHHPDPTVPEYMTDLIAKVKETKADLGSIQTKVVGNLMVISHIHMEK